MAVVEIGRRRGDRGAAAVEFALVTPLLLVLLFGIIDYGIWFSDSISARQAVRDTAREGVVEQFGSCGGGGLAGLACTVKSTMGQISGTTAVKISVVANPSAPTPGATLAWAQGETLRICAMTKHDTLLPFVPFPNGGISYTRVDMPIESAAAVGTLRPTYTDTPPGTANWSWCP